MKIQIQPGIDATQLAIAIRRTIIAAAEAEAVGRAKVAEAREKLIKTVVVPDTTQGKLF